MQTLIQPLNLLIFNMEVGMSVSVHRGWDQVSEAEDHKGEFSLDLYEAAASISIPHENFPHWSICTEWRKRVLICLKVFEDVNNYSRFVSVFIHGGFIISGPVPKGLSPRDDNIDSCL